MIAVNSSADPPAEPDKSDYEGRLRLIMKEKDPNIRLKQFTDLGIEAGRACATETKGTIDPNSPRKDAADKIIDAITNREFSGYICKEQADKLNAVNTDDPNDPNAAGAIQLFMDQIDYKCNSDRTFAQMANEGQKCQLY